MWVGYAKNTTKHAPLNIGQQPIEQVDKFTYLRCILRSDVDAEHDITCRIGKALAVFQRLKLIWTATTISIKTKERLFSSIVVPTAIYATETWKMSARIAQILNVFQQRCLWRILGVSYRDHISNDEIHRRTDIRPLQEVVTECRLRFAGHILQRPPSRHARIALLWKPPHGKRKQGWPRIT